MKRAARRNVLVKSNGIYQNGSMNVVGVVERQTFQVLWEIPVLLSELMSISQIKHKLCSCDSYTHLAK